MKNVIICALAIFAFLTSACNSGYEYNTYVVLSEKGWGADSLAVFRPEIPDAEKPYDVWFLIRNENDYPYANLWLFIEAVAPSGASHTDTLECYLANPDGTWVGGGWGSLYSARYPYRLHTRFAQDGVYTFRVSHGMRADVIEGINSIGMQIVESEQFADGEK